MEDDKEGCSQGEEESTENVVTHPAQRRAADGNTKVGSAGGHAVKRNSRRTNRAAGGPGQQAEAE